ncbi:MAG: hypothetical protein KAQ91_04785 [Methylococcales bacterium]|nr:hypothetical protein [Methylococcales bacterium]
MKNKAFLFIIALIALLVFQAKVVMPFVQDIASSDLFLETSGDEMNRVSDQNQMTIEAFRQCNSYISTEVLPSTSLTFPEHSINAFSLGNYQYVINADLEISPDNAAAFTRRYVCRIKYLNGSDNSEVSVADNWSIEATSGLDNINLD